MLSRANCTSPRRLAAGGVTHPGRNGDGKAGAVGNIVKRAELVTDPVRAPVFDASLAEHAIVSDVGCEGKFCPGVEIVRMIVEPEAELHGCFNGRDAETVCERDMGCCR